MLDSTPHQSRWAGKPRRISHSSTSVSAWRALNILAAVAALAFAGVAAAPAEAHGRLGAAEGRCRLFIGPDIMNFTGYLPEASKNEFCEDIPSTGPMIMVLDAEQAELRDMMVELRIVKDVGGEEKENENIEAVTVAYREPKTYPNGTINFSHTFGDPGYFVGIVTVTGDHGERWVSRFPFSVGKSFMRDLPYYILLALGTIATFMIWMAHRRLAPAPNLVAAAAAFKPPPPPDVDPPGFADGVPTSRMSALEESAEGAAAEPAGAAESGGGEETPPDRATAKKDDDAQKAIAAE